MRAIRKPRCRTGRPNAVERRDARERRSNCDVEKGMDGFFNILLRATRHWRNGIVDESQQISFVRPLRITDIRLPGVPVSVYPQCCQVGGDLVMRPAETPRVQESRKQAGLEVSDRIVLGVSGSAGVDAALAEHRDYLMSETLATAWQVGQEDPLFCDSRTLDDEEWTIEIRKI